jgi:hypothetical protein
MENEYEFHHEIDTPPTPTYWLTRFVILRLLGVIYAIAFLVAINQVLPLIGSNGLTPVGLYLKRVSAALGSDTAGFLRLPSLFWFGHSDAVLLAVAWIGLLLSCVVIAGYANALSLAVLWILYMSIVHVGQEWYGYGYKFMQPNNPCKRKYFHCKVINQAIGTEEEIIQPVIPIIPYHERLPCLELIATATGIRIALQRLLETLCKRLQQEQKGLRTACFKGYRMDGKVEQVDIATIRATSNVSHLFKLFEEKIQTIEPDLGIELFILEAPKVEEHAALQEQLWQARGGLEDIHVAELIDRLTGKIGSNCIHRFLPGEHYWPERSIKPAASLQETSATEWRLDAPRPLQLLSTPEQIDVMAIVPDNPPIHFRYKGKMHKIIKADGPERIEQEWWIEEGKHRDYYAIEDEDGCRYWVFRLGHYHEDYKWFVHGFFV